MTQDSQTISVIIPSYNRCALLPRALDSVLGQTRPANEIIVVDDGSSDDTCQMMQQRYPHITLLQQSNRGVSAARNAGIDRATGDWIALLDSDDEWLPEKLERQLNAIASQPNAVLCHTDEIWIRRGQRVNPMHKHRKYGGHIFKHCLPLCVISPSAALIKRSLFDEVGLFDESLPACEDYDLWLRICARHPVLYLEQALIKKYGGHNDQLSQRHWGMDRFRIQALLNILQSDTLNHDHAQATRNMLTEKCHIVAQGAVKRGNHSIAQHYQQLALQHLEPLTSTARSHA